MDTVRSDNVIGGAVLTIKLILVSCLKTNHNENLATPNQLL